MHPRATHLISTLNLIPHPEGGHYRQIYRSLAEVKPLDQRSARPALTTIYFLLTEGEKSRWHQVASDEVWHYYEGDPLELLQADGNLQRITPLLLGSHREGVQPVQIIPGGDWQAARTTGAYSLVGCTVGPGFDFSDFRMLADFPEHAKTLASRHPQFSAYV